MRESLLLTKEGHSSVQKNKEAMGEILEITNIIGELARQTNLLALNAAIEAARAGEFGKGFSVVAGEVRKLADRSAAAAEDISSISSESHKTAEAAGTVLSDLLPKIESAAAVIEEITALSKEQMDNISSITEASAKLDEIGNNNAATSEEMSNSCDVLKEKTLMLLETVESFKL